MEKIIVAFATDNRNDFTKEHFGEAKEYLVYEISKANSFLLDTISNKSPEEKKHGDPNKAKGVAALLKPHGVKVLISKDFGRNIVRQQQKFVVILSSTLIIEEAIRNIQKNYSLVIEEWEKGETRDYLRI